MIKFDLKALGLPENRKVISKYLNGRGSEDAANRLLNSLIIPSESESPLKAEPKTVESTEPEADITPQQDPIVTPEIKVDATELPPAPKPKKTSKKKTKKD